jgi:galactose-1-phosphate uridylyltransferase
MCLVPRAHQSCFASHLGTGKLVESFARLLARVLTTLERMLPGAGYNVMLVTEDPADHLHWRLEIVPRTAAFAGIELLSGVYICTVDPGVAAAQLRGAW